MTKTYRLGSNPLVSAPGMVRWAKSAYRFRRDRKVIRNVILAGWPGVTPKAAHKLLIGDVEYRVVEEEVVEFTV